MMNENTLEQEKTLDNATKKVKAEAFEMKRCLDKGRTMDALKHALQFLNELRTAELSPKFYYRLYMDSVNELQQLEAFLVDDFTQDPTKILNLYECVQYAGSIIPRLYLLVTIGVAFIKCKIGSKKELLKDLVEMCRGVQHPLRGLFLRNYLLQSTRSLLPDSQYTQNSGPDGDVADAVDFVLINFAEMNKLWVRMQHQGPSREREKRERDRMELRILVGTNLVRLAQLDSLTEEMYVREVLPSVLEQVVSCHDPISQEYLMECVIQVFADDFHLATLNEFLGACKELAPEVNVKNVLIALIDRLALYTTSSESTEPTNMHLFKIFSDQAKDLIASRPDMPMEDVVSLHTSLVSLAVRAYSDKIDYTDMSYGSLRKILEEKGIEKIEVFGAVGRQLTKLLQIPISEYNNCLLLAKIPELTKVMRYFDYRGRCNFARFVIQNIADNNTKLRTEDDVKTVFELVGSMLKDEPDTPPPATDDEEFVDDQNMVAKLIHMFDAETLETQYILLNNCRKVLGEGGALRIRYTLPSIVFSLYKLILKFKDQKDVDLQEKWDAKVRKMFVCAMGTVGALVSTAGLAELPLKLYLQGAVCADKMGFEDNHTVVYEFISKAMSILEDDVADSRDRVRCLQLTIGTLLETQHLPEENWQPLASQCVLAATKMFKKPDQVRSLVSVAGLYWYGKTIESNGQIIKCGKKVVDILRKAAKISSECLEPLVQQQLFMTLLSAYTTYYEQRCAEVDVDHIEQLIKRTTDNAVNLDVSAEADNLERQLGEAIKRVKLATMDLENAEDEVEKVAEVKVPEVKVAEVKVAEVRAPEVKAPEVTAPEVNAPEVEAPKPVEEAPQKPPTPERPVVAPRPSISPKPVAVPVLADAPPPPPPPRSESPIGAPPPIPPRTISPKPVAAAKIEDDEENSFNPPPPPISDEVSNDEL